MKIFLCLFLTVLIIGCSNKAVYDNIQMNNRNECKKLPQSQYEDCMEKANKSYEEYERERKEVQNK